MKSNKTSLNWRPFGWAVPRLLLVSLSGLLFIILLVGVSTSTAAFSPYNANWDGTGEFRQLASSTGDSTIVTNTSQYTQVNSSDAVAFVFAPEEEYSPTDVAVVRQFVLSGGTLVVADDYGAIGNRLLGDIGANASFDGRILRDNRNNFRSPSTPVVADPSNHELVSNVESITLNYGTAIESSGTTPLINSSEFSYLVTTENETLNDADKLQQSPVATVESIGQGQVIAVGDPSIFINSMIDKSDNRQFAVNLIEYQPDVVFDQSHTSSPPPLVQLVLTLRSSPLLAAGLLTILIVVITRIGQHQSNTKSALQDNVIKIIDVLPYTDRLRTSPAIESQVPISSPEALKKQLRNRHPEWDDEQIDVVIAGILSPERSDSENE